MPDIFKELDRRKSEAQRGQSHPSPLGVLVVRSQEADGRYDEGVDQERLITLLRLSQIGAVVEARTGVHPAAEETQAILDGTAELPPAL